MNIIKRLFLGNNKATNGQNPDRSIRSMPQGRGSKSRQLPSSQVAGEFGEVNVIDYEDGRREVELTILLVPSGRDGEGWQTGVALDASGSMLHAYGHRFVAGPGAPAMTPEFRAQLTQRGLIQECSIDGKARSYLTESGKSELRRLGYTNSPNVVEPCAREFTAYLAEKLDADGGTTVIYWACGSGGQFEVIGDLTAEDCKKTAFVGPSTSVGFGKGTLLVPAMKYFVDRFADAKSGMYVFITDGRLDDLEDVKQYTIALCREIAQGTRNKLKFVLIGVGDAIDEDQMTELDDLDSGTDVDLWDHKIAAEMRQLAEIFAELVDEHQIVAPMGSVIAASGTTLKSMSDGVPARIRFDIDASESWFELVVGEHRIRQIIPSRS